MRRAHLPIDRARRRYPATRPGTCAAHRDHPDSLHRVTAAGESPTLYYALLIRIDPELTDEMTPQDFVARAAAIDAFDEALTEAGRNVGSVRLSSSREARVVRLRQGEPSISTGPFQTTPEQIGGIYLVEANHLGGASEIAERLVRAGIGSVEVRPILGIDLRATVAHDPGV